MWLVLATAITVATPTGATVESSSVTYAGVGTATLTVALAMQDGTATTTFDVPPDARVTAIVTSRGTARLDFVDKTRTRQRIRLTVTASVRAQVTITIELIERPYSYVSWFKSLVATAPAPERPVRPVRVLAEPTYCGVGR